MSQLVKAGVRHRPEQDRACGPGWYPTRQRVPHEHFIRSQTHLLPENSGKLESQNLRENAELTHRKTSDTRWCFSGHSRWCNSCPCHSPSLPRPPPADGNAECLGRQITMHITPRGRTHGGLSSDQRPRRFWREAGLSNPIDETARRDLNPPCR